MKWMLPLLFAAAPALADNPRIVDVQARASASGWTFNVTVAHADTGWDHYADGWEISAPDGTVLGHRTLTHPHVNEQPFTRSLSGVAIPDAVQDVQVRAHDTVHGWGEMQSFTLPR
nr:hypothetical protein [Monaibacterium marinum]